MQIPTISEVEGLTKREDRARLWEKIEAESPNLFALINKVASEGAAGASLAVILSGLTKAAPSEGHREATKFVHEAILDMLLAIGFGT